MDESASIVSRVHHFPRRVSTAAVLAATILFSLAAAEAQFIPAEKPPELLGLANADRAEFGFVAVPERRSDPGSATIQLAVLVVRAKNGSALPDPVFYLVGGPGGSATLSSARFPVFDALNETRDIVFVDPRGAGFSEPNLSMRRGGYSLAGFVNANRNAFAQEGIDVTGYNTTEIAQDYEAVRAALGYAQVNVFASSYGTFVVQELIRRHPASLRCVVTSGNSPATDPFLPTVVAGERAGIEELLRDVRRDRKARKTFPKFRKRFYALLEGLNEKPVRLILRNTTTGRPQSVKIDGAAFVTTMVRMLQRTETIRLIPALVAEMEPKKYGALTRRFFAPFSRMAIENPFGMYLSVLGTDFAAPGYLRATERGIDRVKAPALVEAEGSLVLELADIVVRWNVPYAPGTTRTLPTGNVPTLLLNGRMDAQTPASGGARIAAGLSLATNYVYPRVGHAVGFERGPDMDAAVAFIQNPAVVPPYSRGNRKKPGFYKTRVSRVHGSGGENWPEVLPDPPIRFPR